MQAVPEAIQSLYQSTWIRGRKITRMEEEPVGHFELDATTAWELGANNIGVFVGSCRSFDDIVRRLRRLESDSLRPSWLVVTCAKDEAVTIVRRWFKGDHHYVPDPEVPSELQRPERHQNIIISTPEKLRHVDRSYIDEVAGIIVIDPNCIIYQARGGVQRGRYYRNDRPQRVADFRNQLVQDGWTPPFFLLTTKPAKSVNTHSVARAFCLDAFWFVNGPTLSCGPVRVETTASLDAE